MSLGLPTQEYQRENEIKTQFTTREGLYKVVNLNDYSRQCRQPYNGQTTQPVNVSFVTVEEADGTFSEKIAYNIGRELFFFNYRGVKKNLEHLNKPIDKKIYKGTVPTCHDFNQKSASADGVPTLVGFSHGQVQLIDPLRNNICKLFNEERLIDKTRVTCVRWIPNSEKMFLVSHHSGSLYMYNEDHPGSTTPPHYTVVKQIVGLWFLNYLPSKRVLPPLVLQGNGYSVHVCKSKSSRNPLFRWIVGEGAIQQFTFSPDGVYLATVSQDGFLRIFNFNSLELHSCMKSYFGGLLSVAWSHDGKIMATGGEDDLLTIWSTTENAVLARGKGHRSWVGQVAFDPFTSKREDEGPPYYRLGSVGHDTYLCLWDISPDILCPTRRPRLGSHRVSPSDGTQGETISNKFHTLQLSAGRIMPGGDKRNSLPKTVTSGSSTVKLRARMLDDTATRLLGTPQCPFLDEVPLLEPLVTKKISHEQLSSLTFREDCIVTACHEGFLLTWSRPEGGTVV